MRRWAADALTERLPSKGLTLPEGRSGKASLR